MYLTAKIRSLLLDSPKAPVRVSTNRKNEIFTLMVANDTTRI